MADLRNVAGLNPRGVQIIPDRWEAHHRPVAEAGMTATVESWSGSDQDWIWDDAAQAEIRDYGTLLWAGVARVQERVGGGDESAGDQQLTLHSYMVSIPHDAPVGGWVRVIESTDPLLDWLKVVDVLKGSIRWQRDLMCTDHLG